MNERDVEIEHLKTTVIAMNEKVEVTSLILTQMLIYIGVERLEARRSEPQGNAEAI